MRLALLLVLAPLAAFAESAPAHLYLAADPLPYALHGFSIHGGVVLPGGNFSLEAALFSSRLSESLLTLVEPPSRPSPTASFPSRAPASSSSRS